MLGSLPKHKERYLKKKNEKLFFYCPFSLNIILVVFLDEKTKQNSIRIIKYKMAKNVITTIGMEML